MQNLWLKGDLRRIGAIVFILGRNLTTTINHVCDSICTMLAGKLIPSTLLLVNILLIDGQPCLSRVNRSTTWLSMPMRECDDSVSNRNVGYMQSWSVLRRYLQRIQYFCTFSICEFVVGSVVCFHWRYLRLSNGPEYVTCGRYTQ